MNDSAAKVIRRLLGLARPHAGRLAIATVFLLIGSGAGLAVPRFIGDLLGEVLESGQRERVDELALAMLVLFAVQGLAVSIRYYLFASTGERIVTDLRRSLFRRILEQDVGFFDGQRTGDLLSRLSSDTSILQNAVSINISMGLRNLAAVLGGVALLGWTSWRLTLVMLAIVPPVVVGAFVWGRLVRRLSRRGQEALGRASEVAEETISSVRTIRTFNREESQAEAYNVAIEHAWDVALERFRHTARLMAVAMFLGYASVAAVLWYGGRLVVDGQMSMGDLTAFVLYTLIVAFSLAALGSVLTDLLRAGGAADRIFEIEDRVEAMPLRGGLRPAACEGRVELEAVTFHYPSRPDLRVLDAITLRLEPGERVALVGMSGGGKSTIAALLSRLYDPTDGVVRFDGHDLRTLDPEWVRAHVAVVEQEPVLLSTTVADNIRFGDAEASVGDVERAAREANAFDFVAGFPEGFDTRVGERGVQLSGGQKQRVAIARAILKNPRVLILDEATSALDAESEHLVKEALDRLMRGRTTLLIAHRLSTVRDADRVVVIERGRIVEEGTHDALVAREGAYHRLVERQFAL